MLKLESKNGDEFCVSLAAAKGASNLLRHLLDEEDDDDGCSEGQQCVPLPNVSSATLRHVIVYINHHHQVTTNDVLLSPALPTIPKPLHRPIEDVLEGTWELDFVEDGMMHGQRGEDDASHQVLLDVMEAANYLHITPLLELCCAFVSNLIQDCTVEQITSWFPHAADDEEHTDRDAGNADDVIVADPFECLNVDLLGIIMSFVASHVSCVFELVSIFPSLIAGAAVAEDLWRRVEEDDEGDKTPPFVTSMGFDEAWRNPVRQQLISSMSPVRTSVLGARVPLSLSGPTAVFTRAGEAERHRSRLNNHAAIPLFQLHHWQPEKAIQLSLMCERLQIDPDVQFTISSKCTSGYGVSEADRAEAFSNRLQQIAMRLCGDQGATAAVETTDDWGEGMVEEDDREYEHALRHLTIRGSPTLSHDDMNLLSRTLRDSMRTLELSSMSCVTDTTVSLLHFPQLQELSLPECSEITSTSMRFLINQMPNLTELDLSGCTSLSFDGVDWNIMAPNTTNNWEKSLTSLDVSRTACGNRQCMNSVAWFTNLSTLDMSKCPKVTDDGLAQLALHLKKLKRFACIGCFQVTPGGVAALLTEQDHLKTLEIGAWDPRVTVSQATMETICTRTEGRLTRFDAPLFPNFSDALLSPISCLYSSLTALDLTGSCTHNVTPDGYEKIFQLTQLKHLNLAQCMSLEDVVLEKFATENGATSNLESLNISHCKKVTMRGGISKLSVLPKLTSLSVVNCFTFVGNTQAHDKDSPQHFLKLKSLLYLNASCCSCTDDTIESIAAHPTIRALDLVSNNFLTNAAGDVLLKMAVERCLVQLSIRGCHQISSLTVKQLHQVVELDP